MVNTGEKHGNKRKQIVRGLLEVDTPFVVFKDDTTFWPSQDRFLRAILAPFEDNKVAGVGSNKRVIREQDNFWKPKWSNFFGCLYLDRHNMETVSTKRLDGGVWVISGRTCAFRTDIVKSRTFQEAYLNEYMLFGQLGPLNTDDDLFVSRWIASQGHKLFFQIGEDAMMYTTIDIPWKKFNEKLLRWIRGPYGRSNPRSVLEISRLWKYPWTYYSVHISALINFAVVWDPLLLLTLYKALSDSPDGSRILALAIMATWIISSKVVKLLPHFSRNPRDLRLFPVQCRVCVLYVLRQIPVVLDFLEPGMGQS